MNRFENTVPPNYLPLPAAAQVPGPGLGQTSHELLRAGRVHASLTVQMTAIDPVRVGSGVLFPLPGKGILAADLVLRDGTPILPGSSLKGVLRSTAEALGGGCDLGAPCDPPCVACQLFGFVQSNRHFAGRVGIEDALPLRPREIRLLPYTLPRAFQPRRQVGRRVYGPASPGAQLSVPTLAVAPGAVFSTRLHVENLSRGEAGLIALALGLDGSFCPRVGGGKFHGLGRVRVVASRARIRRDGYRTPPEVVQGDELAAELAGWLAEVKLTELGQRALTALRTTLRAP